MHRMAIGSIEMDGHEPHLRQFIVGTDAWKKVASKYSARLKLRSLSQMVQIGIREEARIVFFTSEYSLPTNESSP